MTSLVLGHQTVSFHTACAQAAADALQAIFPSVTATGVAATIPMPGHPPATEQLEAGLLEAVRQLDELVASHDALFLLTDTRESRCHSV
jgi:ubiquitin-like modifier-activating enzyme ATG7